MSEYSWLLEERADSELKDMLQSYLRERQDHENEVNRLKAIIQDIDRELEMRQLAGGFEELKAFRTKLKRPTKTEVPVPESLVPHEAQCPPRPKKEEKKWCSICLSGPSGLWQHAEPGNTLCRHHK